MTQTQRANAAASKVILKCALTVLLLSGLIGQCSAACRRQPLIHAISLQGCTTRRVPSYGCRGTCTSYSRVSPADYTQMERSCQCCQEADHEVRMVRLRCPGLYPSVRMVELRMAESCTCRPCHGMSGVPSETRLEDFLQ